MTDRTPLTKIIDGLYEIGDIQIARDGSQGRMVGRWFLTSRRIDGQPRFRTIFAAEIAARAYLGEEITDAEYAELKKGSI